MNLYNFLMCALMNRLCINGMPRLSFSRRLETVIVVVDHILQHFTLTTWKTHFGSGHRLPLVTGNAPVTDQVLQISQER
jgi:hypothetical protein